VRAGSLDRRVTIQRQSESRDSHGGVVVSWVDVATVWADLSAVTGREYVQAQAVQDETTVKIVIRFRSGITTGKLRVLAYENDQGGSPTTQTVYDVLAILPSGDRKRWLQLMCKAGVSNG
jgi:SPP1 family predicted phage head-tail adaptor